MSGEQLEEQIQRDRIAWKRLSPTIRKALLNELAAIWSPRITP